jgi:mRNA interferase MazF
VSLRRGDVCWADLAEPRGSAPGYRRPVVVVSSDRFNRSRIRTVIVAAVTTSPRVAAAPGNLALRGARTGLDRDCTVNVSALLTVEKADLEPRVGALDAAQRRGLDEGLRLVLAL